MGINVLSLFDGMSCGRIALERAGIEVDNYYSSEIDKYAIKVAMSNYPDIIQLGDITKWKEWNLPKIDLIIGGSPCQGFSFVGKQLAFEDPRSKLFFKFVDVLRYYNPKYFLLENVRMKKEYQDVISKHLEVEPICINSNLVSAQNRVRYYWTNIRDITQPNDKGIFAKDIKSHNCNDLFPATIVYNKGKKFVKFCGNMKMPTLTTSCKSPNGLGRPFWSVNEFYVNKPFDYKKIHRISILECERLQTVPDNYTNYVSDAQRYKMLGNGWTVDVIAHILKNIKKSD